MSLEKPDPEFKVWPLTGKEPPSSATIAISLPPEVAPYAADIMRFVDAMVYKLKVHHKKGKWENVTARDNLRLLDDEILELKEAVHDGNMVEVLLESADVANFALIQSAIAINK